MLGNVAGRARFTAVVNARAQPGIPHQVILIRETANVANGSQDGHSGQQADTWNLDE